MSREKQIEEMAKDLDGVGEFTILGLNDAFIKVKVAYDRVAEKLYNAGYRKQSEGEWVKDEVGETLCSECGVRPLYRKSGTTFATTFYPTRSNYCPNCGAKMKGGGE